MFDDEELIVFKSYYEIKFCSVQKKSNGKS